MLRFKFLQLYLERRQRYFLSLPKLSEPKFDVLSVRLQEDGFIKKGDSIFKKKHKTVRVDRQGLASSTFDLTDLIAPIIPEMLAAKAERKKIANPYYVLRCKRMESCAIQQEYQQKLPPESSFLC